MKSIRKHALAIALALAAPLMYAADANEHAGHHPENAPAAPASKAPSTAANAVKPSDDQAMKMDAQMKVMREMHDKMMQAKTPEERKAMMAEHMKTMKNGMSMMNGMSGAPAKGSKPASPQAMQRQIDMMQKKMDMMQTMMPMMMDCMEMQMAAK
jgi:hypothetical protein